MSRACCVGMSARCAHIRADATVAATTRPAEASYDGSRTRDDIGFPAVLRELRLLPDKWPPARLQARPPEDVAPVVLGDPGRLAGVDRLSSAPGPPGAGSPDFPTARSGFPDPDREGRPR